MLFRSANADQPAMFYYNSAPAHTTYPDKKITPEEASPATLDAPATSNRRTINKFIVPDVLPTCQLTMGLTRLMASEWAKYGINVNAIAPGYMATNNTLQLRNDEARSEEILACVPAGRWGNPDDMMGPMIFLASSASDYVNGFTLAVDGGWLAR